MFETMEDFIAERTFIRSRKIWTIVPGTPTIDHLRHHMKSGHLQFLLYWKRKANFCQATSCCCSSCTEVQQIGEIYGKIRVASDISHSEAEKLPEILEAVTLALALESGVESRGIFSLGGGGGDVVRIMATTVRVI
jgi:hypothetical protein